MIPYSIMQLTEHTNNPTVISRLLKELVNCNQSYHRQCSHDEVESAPISSVLVVLRCQDGSRHFSPGGSAKSPYSSLAKLTEHSLNMKYDLGQFQQTNFTNNRTCVVKGDVYTIGTRSFVVTSCRLTRTVYRNSRVLLINNRETNKDFL